MQTIYKYQLRPQEGTSSITVGMPRDAKILSVGTQVGRLGRGEDFYDALPKRKPRPFRAWDEFWA
jgi:hypothetical protein